MFHCEITQMTQFLFDDDVMDNVYVRVCILCIKSGQNQTLE